jgi:tetratricopeptide (TPR) repeat protein
MPEFYDEPRFTVAGVTEAANPGGHGSNAVLRNTETLTRETVLLKKESPTSSQPASFGAVTETSLREAAEHDPGNAGLHHSLADLEEKLGNPLAAVREYQRAAELDPSEPHLFDWGADLLLHRALEPATEVFAKGNRLFPRSVRILVGLGVSWYARGSYDRAAQRLCEASDLNPDDPNPYLFLGKMLIADAAQSEGSLERLARFARLQPDNALANYYYALGLWKQRTGSEEAGDLAPVESLLHKAVRLDPKLGVGYLQLGILYSERQDFSKAISAYQEAITADSQLEQAYYRLAQAYLRTGEKLKAQQELQLYEQIAKKKEEEGERQRREIQQFVYTLRERTSAAQPQ